MFAMIHVNGNAMPWSALPAALLTAASTADAAVKT
jgi:hypothetical protein